MSEKPPCGCTGLDYREYLRHKRAGEKACALAKKAWRTYYAKRKGKK